MNTKFAVVVKLQVMKCEGKVKQTRQLPSILNFTEARKNSMKQNKRISNVGWNFKG